MDIQEILKDKNTKVIDVREEFEFNTERVPNAINMPLSRFGVFIDEIKKMKGKKVFYCRSGNRSGQAVAHLKSIGMNDVYNGGSLFLMKMHLVA